MSERAATGGTVQELEALMLEHFETEPFHNLGLLYGPRLRTALSGGTCSDKTLSFVAAAKRADFAVALHSGFIGGREIHRLARVHICGRVFFADVGNGWPALRLYPADREVSYRVFGMGFRTELVGERLRVFHTRRGRESLQLEIDPQARPQSEILAEIEARFSSGIAYPFSSSLRFSLVVGQRFLFLRGDRLEIYADSGFECQHGVHESSLPTVLREHFGIELPPVWRHSPLLQRKKDA